MKNINIGIIGGGYMGKAHASAFSAVGAVFETKLKPVLHSVCASSPESAKRYAQAFGFKHAKDNWQSLVQDPEVDAIIVASPQSTHRIICEAAFLLGKPVLCEKPLGASSRDAAAMTTAAEKAVVVNMVGFNYIRTPIVEHARKMVHQGILGDIISFRATHTEDFLSSPNEAASWRTHGRANGNMGDLAPHIIHHALMIMGPIKDLIADITTVYPVRPSSEGEVLVTNDDQASLLCHFANGVSGSLFISRVATGKKMGIEFEITGTKGALKFDQEDQNSLHYYDTQGRESERGFRRILAGPEHGNYGYFSKGPGHGTGYLDQIISQAAAFLHAIETNGKAYPSFRDGLAVSNVVDAAWRSHESRSWVTL